MSIHEPQPTGKNITAPHTPLRPARPYLCVAVPLELAHMAAESRVDPLFCVDPIGRKVYSIAPTDLVRQGVLCGDDLITPLADRTVQR
jgi:hypothetical protein